MLKWRLIWFLCCFLGRLVDALALYNFFSWHITEVGDDDSGEEEGNGGGGDRHCDGSVSVEEQQEEWVSDNRTQVESARR